MRLRILLPTEVLVDEAVAKVVSEAENGAFCLLPRHRDFVTALVPGILTFLDTNQIEGFVAIGEGILVKSGPDLSVSTRNAVRGTDLGILRDLVARRFGILNEKERIARSAIAKLEADFARRFIEFGTTATGSYRPNGTISGGTTRV